MPPTQGREKWQVQLRVAWPIWAGGYPSPAEVESRFKASAEALRARMQEILEGRFGGRFDVEEVKVQCGGPAEIGGTESHETPNSVELGLTFSGSSVNAQSVRRARSRVGEEIAKAVHRVAVEGRGGANLYEVEVQWTEEPEPDRSRVVALGREEPLSDEHYQRLLLALGRKHIRSDSRTAGHEYSLELERMSHAARLWHAVRRDADPALMSVFVNRLEDNPVKVATEAMRESGILDALEDAPTLVLGGLRRSMIPMEDIEFLRRAGFSDDEIELLIAGALEDARAAAAERRRPEAILAGAKELLKTATPGLLSNSNATAESHDVHPPRTRKLLNGIGKILAGVVAGVGNAMMATATIKAPNPSTTSGAIASAGLALSGILSGAGDLRGE